ncbi:hypothetical protein NHX12_023727 [Muraenolepis orangiensis]|uniref:Uncharacterized protein n=1 Tax=Muraenolepis orangiensis TaxID=630683 RepID=A0A9Q0EMQ3_9TELE|nr:hypothetical protein NHX12_023727 [Muraenolepis orangiensis]
MVLCLWARAHHTGSDRSACPNKDLLRHQQEAEAKEVHFSESRVMMADVSDTIDTTMKNYRIAFEKVDHDINRYPWLIPFIGHMGICTSTGVIRDFAGPYFVSEDNMAFGRPTKYWMLDVSKVYASGSNAWDTAVSDASEEYKHRMVNSLLRQPTRPQTSVDASHLGFLCVLSMNPS